MQGSGPDGRITAQDIKTAPSAAAQPAAPTPAAPPMPGNARLML